MTIMTTTYTKEEGDDKDNDGEVYVDGTARRQPQQWSLHRKTVGCLSFPTIIWVWGYQTES